MPGNQIDFPASGPGPVPPRYDRKSLPPQVAVCQVFPKAAVVSSLNAMPEGVGGAIDEGDHFSTSNSNSITFPRTR